MIDESNFWMVFRSVMPLQFLHSFKLPFFGMVTITPSIQQSGMLRLVQAEWMIGCRTDAKVVAAILNSSAAGCQGRGPCGP